MQIKNLIRSIEKHGLSINSFKSSIGSICYECIGEKYSAKWRESDYDKGVASSVSIIRNGLEDDASTDTFYSVYPSTIKSVVNYLIKK